MLLLPCSSSASLLTLGSDDNYNLSSFIDILEDRGKNMTITDVSSPDIANRFKSNKTQTINLGLTSSAYWLRFTIAAGKVESKDVKTEWLIDLDSQYMHYADLYTPLMSGGNMDWNVQRKGVLTNVAQNQSTYEKVLFSVPQKLDKPLTFYLRLEAKSPYFLSPSICSKDFFYHKLTWKLCWFCIFYGTLLSMFIYNLFVALSIRDKSYFFYLLYLGFTIFYFMGTNGITRDLLFRNDPMVSMPWIAFSMGMMLFGVSMFTKHFLMIKEYSRTINFILNIIILGSLVLSTAIWPWGDMLLFNKLAVSIGTSSTLIMFTVGIIRWRSGFRQARFFTIAFFFTVAGAVILSLTFHGILPYTTLTFYSFQIGSALQALLLSLALADRINIMTNELESYRNHLEELVVQRTAALASANEKLKEAKEIADSASRAKGDFLANMSHEIRTPMNAIIGFSGLAMKQDLTPKVHDYISKIESSAKSLMVLINDILDFSKIEAGKLDMESIDFELSSVMDNVANIVSVKTSEKGLELIRSISSEVPNALVGDPLRLGQVLINLANNAVKFTENGQILIKTELVDNDNQSVLLRFSVIDTGIGITKQQMAKLFSAFSQADSSVTRKFGGTGLGLTISKRLVEMMDGEICVESEPGKGSTFSFTARFAGRPESADQEMPTEIRSKSVLQTTDEIRAKIEGAKVLLVEDNALNQQVATEILQSAGLVVEIANNGREGLDMATTGDYDLVLMDVQMPVMGGYEATQLIRKDERFADMPIIAMTAHAMQGHREQSIEIGMNDHVTKPIDPGQLFTALGKWIKPKVRDARREAEVPLDRPKEAAADAYLPEYLHGIDIKSGVKRIGGNRKLFAKLLKEFSRDYEDVTDRIREALDNNDMILAERLAHTVKGVAGNISAGNLAEAARQVESEIQIGLKGDIEQLLKRFAEELAVVHRSIKGMEQAIDTERKEEKETLIDPAVILPLLDRLRSLLAENNLESEAVYESINQALGGKFRDELKQLGEQIDDFDFAGALKTLNMIADNLNIQLEGIKI